MQRCPAAALSTPTNAYTPAPLRQPYHPAHVPPAAQPQSHTMPQCSTASRPPGPVLSLVGPRLPRLHLPHLGQHVEGARDAILPHLLAHGQPHLQQREWQRERQREQGAAEGAGSRGSAWQWGGPGSRANRGWAAMGGWDAKELEEGWQGKQGLRAVATAAQACPLTARNKSAQGCMWPCRCIGAVVLGTHKQQQSGAGQAVSRHSTARTACTARTMQPLSVSSKKGSFTHFSSLWRRTWGRGAGYCG